MNFTFKEARAQGLEVASQLSSPGMLTVSSLRSDTTARAKSSPKKLSSKSSGMS